MHLLCIRLNLRKLGQVLTSVTNWQRFINRVLLLKSSSISSSVFCILYFVYVFFFQIFFMTLEPKCIFRCFIHTKIISIKNPYMQLATDQACRTEIMTPSWVIECSFSLSARWSLSYFPCSLPGSWNNDNAY